MKKDLAVVIPAAGIGKRMRRTYPSVPKALLPVCGRPMISYLLDAVMESGLTEDVVIVVSPMQQKEFDRALAKYRFKYAFQSHPLGSGDAVKCALLEINPTSHNVMVLHCDQPLVSSSTLRALVDTHTTHGGPVTIVTAAVPDFEGWRSPLRDYGRIVRAMNGCFERNVEAADTTSEQFQIKEINVGIYCFDRAWLSSCLEKVQPVNAQSEYYLTDVLTEAKSRLVSVPLWDIEEALGANTPEQLAGLNAILRERPPKQ